VRIERAGEDAGLMEELSGKWEKRRRSEDKEQEQVSMDEGGW
jgi:hypothetical protein